MKRGNRGLLIAALFVTILLCFAAFTACGFLPGGGDGDDSKTIEFRVGDIYKQSVVVHPGNSDPTFDFVVAGYDFLGWFEDEAFTKEFDYDAFMADDKVDSITIYGYLRPINQGQGDHEQGDQDDEDQGHEHALTHFDAVEPTCTTGGNYEYWHCDVCDLDFADAEGKTPLTEKDRPELGHDMYFDHGYAATCQNTGIYEHWYCGRCGEKFYDEEGETLMADVVMPIVPHSLTYYPYKEATCTTQGNMEFWQCSMCGGYFG